MKQDQPYSDHLDNLLALITYLALAKWRSRTPYGISKSLGIGHESIECTLKAFRGLFRESPKMYKVEKIDGQSDIDIDEVTEVPDDDNTQEDNWASEHPYTLHARYAKRRHDPSRDSNQDGTGEELDAAMLRMLLDFVTERAKAEQEAARHRASQIALLAVAAIAAAATIAAAFLSLKH